MKPWWLAVLLTSACGLDSSGNQITKLEDAGVDTGLDAFEDVVGYDASEDPALDTADSANEAADAALECNWGSCTGACCEGLCQPATHDCSACGSTVFCALPISKNLGNCVADCTGCATGSVACHGICEESCD
jgi:hypothetical protein